MSTTHASDGDRKRQLAAIHAEAKRAGLDEDTRRALIERISGGRTRSSADLSGPERQAVLRALLASEAEPRRERRGAPVGPKGVRIRPPAEDDRAALAGKIRALLLDGGYTDAYADAIARRRLGVDRWEWLDFEGQSKLVAMLQIHATRQGRPRP